MSLDGRAVDEELRRGAARTRECLEEVHPHALRGPADIPVVEGFARAIDARRVDPAGARLQHMNDAADHPPIIDARLAPRVGRQVRCNPRELPIPSVTVRFVVYPGGVLLRKGRSILLTGVTSS